MEHQATFIDEEKAGRIENITLQKDDIKRRALEAKQQFKDGFLLEADYLKLKIQLTSDRKKCEKQLRLELLTEEEKERLRSKACETSKRSRKRLAMEMKNLKTSALGMGDNESRVLLQHRGSEGTSAVLKQQDDQSALLIEEEDIDRISSQKRSRGQSRELSALSTNEQPVKAPTAAVSVKKAADRAFVLAFLSSSSNIADVTTKFNRSYLLENDKNGVPRPIKGHLFQALLDHILTVQAQFHPKTGYLLMEETFQPLINRLPLAVRHMYSMDDFRLQFGGVRFWGKYGNGAIGECYLQDFATRLRTLANNFFIKHPAIL